MAMSIPPSLKPVTQYVRRAERLDKAPEAEAPVVAYYCRLYATEQAMKLQGDARDVTAFVTAMIGRLEEDKKKGMSSFTPEEGKTICTDWAVKEFNTADEEDRAGLADQSTARAFYSAGVFFDVLRQFGEADEEMDRRRIYCKWKASHILKAVKEGRTPTPGGAGEDITTGMPSSGGDDAGASAAGGGGVTGVGGEPDGSANQSHQPAPGAAAAETERHDPLAAMIPEAPVDNPFVNPGPSAPGDGSTDFSAPPSASASSTPQYYGGPGIIVPGGGGGGGGGGYAPPAAQDAAYPAGGGQAGVPGAHPSPYAAPMAPSAPAHYVAPAPAPAPAGYVAPAPAGYVAPAPAPYVAPTPSYSPTPPRPKSPVPSSAGLRRSGGGGVKPQEGNMADAMEHCKFAIRALEHRDVEMAVQKLQEALRQIT